jgi:hypothetical protein
MRPLRSCVGAEAGCQCKGNRRACVAARSSAPTSAPNAFAGDVYAGRRAPWRAAARPGARGVDRAVRPRLGACKGGMRHRSPCTACCCPRQPKAARFATDGLPIAGMPSRRWWARRFISRASASRFAPPRQPPRSPPWCSWWRAASRPARPAARSPAAGACGSGGTSSSRTASPSASSAAASITTGALLPPPLRRLRRLRRPRWRHASPARSQRAMQSHGLPASTPQDPARVLARPAGAPGGPGPQRGAAVRAMELP